MENQQTHHGFRYITARTFGASSEPITTLRLNFYKIFNVFSLILILYTNPDVIGYPKGNEEMRPESSYIGSYYDRILLLLNIWRKYL